MIITCEHCGARYKYAEERFEGKRAKKIRCAKCREIFEIVNPQFEDSDSGEETTETTFTSKPEKKGVTEETGSFQPGGLPSLPESQRLSLAVTEGPEAAKVFRVEKPRVTIGRQDADIEIDDRESSRKHAALEVRDGHFFLEDLGSSNGTYVEGRRIEEEVEIFDKSEFRVGATTLMLIVTNIE
ncbi:MAG: FHA domain-containing protein [Thermoanaerobaculia bacterium]|nr:FHA domain-containing protein [Thermoanaerobaculia bacterium]